VAFNHSSIVENVTQTTPNCWSPAGATINPGHNVKFEPITFTPCTTAVLTANATGISCKSVLERRKDSDKQLPGRTLSLESQFEFTRRDLDLPVPSDGRGS